MKPEEQRAGLDHAAALARRAAGFHRGRAAALALLAGCAAQGAMAQAGAAPSVIGDVLVTALGRAAPAQGLPLAVSAFAGATIEARGWLDLAELARTTPSMVAVGSVGRGGAPVLVLRGLGTNETQATVAPAVPLFVDGVRLTGGVGDSLTLFDAERVEVLRGPQPVLFGAGTAGAVHILLAAPGQAVSGFGEVGRGNHDGWLVRGSADIPMSSKLAFKLSGYSRQSDGWARNSTTGGRVNDRDATGLRLAARLAPSDRLSWQVALAITADKGDNLPVAACNPGDPLDCDGRWSATGLSATRRQAGEPQYDLPVSGDKARLVQGQETDTTLLTSTLEWAGDRHRLALVTGLVDSRQQLATDLADGRGLPDLGAPAPPVRGFRNGGTGVLQDATVRQLSQEVRLAGSIGFVDYVAGALFERRTERRDQADLVTLEDGTAGGAASVLADRRYSRTTETRAGYARLEAHLRPWLTASAGLRHSHVTDAIDVVDNRAGCQLLPRPAGCFGGVVVAASGAEVPGRLTTDAWTPQLAVTVRPRPELLLYASAGRGFRPAGWAVRATAPEALLPFSAETGWTYEAGVKSDWLGGRFRANLTAFLIDMDRLQLASATAGADGIARFATSANAGFRNKGLELELAAAPVQGLLLWLNAGWQDAAYRVPGGTGADRWGVKSVRQQQLDCVAQLGAGLVALAPGAARATDCASGIVTATGGVAAPVYAPDWTASFGGSWDVALPRAGAILAPSAVLRYRSAMETDTANVVIPGRGEGRSRAAAAWQLDAGLALRTDDEAWRVALECSNCLGREVQESSLLGLGYLAPPRLWMVRARRQF